MLNDKTEKMNQATADFSLADKERLRIDNPRLENLYSYLSDAAKNSYSDPLLLSNAVFAKSDLPLSALDDYLEGKEIERISFSISVKLSRKDCLVNTFFMYSLIGLFLESLGISIPT